MDSLRSVYEIASRGPKVNVDLNESVETAGTLLAHIDDIATSSVRAVRFGDVSTSRNGGYVVTTNIITDQRETTLDYNIYINIEFIGDVWVLTYSEFSELRGGFDYLPRKLSGEVTTQHESVDNLLYKLTYNLFLSEQLFYNISRSKDIGMAGWGVSELQNVETARKLYRLMSTKVDSLKQKIKRSTNINENSTPSYKNTLSRVYEVYMGNIGHWRKSDIADVVLGSVYDGIEKGLKNPKYFTLTDINSLCEFGDEVYIQSLSGFSVKDALGVLDDPKSMVQVSKYMKDNAGSPETKRVFDYSDFRLAILNLAAREIAMGFYWAIEHELKSHNLVNNQYQILPSPDYQFD